MIPTSRAYKTLQAFHKSIAFAGGAVRLGKGDYYAWEDVPFEKWRDRYIAELRRNPDVDCGHSRVLLPLLRKKDILVIGNQLGAIDTWERADEWFFSAGRYDKIRSLKHWRTEQDSEISLNHEYQFEGDEGEAISIRECFKISKKERLQLCKNFKKAGIVGNSTAMVVLYQKTAQACRGIRKYPDQLPNILVIGSSGTGKELMARAIHELSERKKPIRVVNCATLSEHLLESELFGYEAGAFTGALAKGRLGILAECKEGTLQLDEINKLAPELCGKLLRALEEKEIRKVGSGTPQQIDVLIVATTNESLATRVEEGSFPNDMYQRLSGVTLDVPSLSQRVDDVPLLLEHFLAHYPGNSLGRYRFPLALGFMHMARGSLTVRELRDRVRQLVAESLGEEGEERDDERRQKLNRALGDVRSEGTKITRAAVAQKIGISRSALSKRPWKRLVEEQRDEFTQHSSVDSTNS